MSREEREQIERLIQKTPMYKEALTIYRDLVEFLDEVDPDIKYAIKHDSAAETKIKEGFPLFSREALPINFNDASSLFHRLFEHLSSKGRKDRKALKKASEKVLADSDWVKSLASAFLSRDESTISSMAAELNLEPMVLKFLIHMALTPFLSRLRKDLKGRIPRDGWNYGICPLCGSFPDMAYLNEQGKRFLHCELCGEEWPYSRIKCPFCGNHKTKELGYFVSEDDKGFRVDFCKRCNGYIKTLDTRIMGSLAPMELENLITLHLDMLAHEQGFKSPSC